MKTNEWENFEQGNSKKQKILNREQWKCQSGKLKFESKQVNETIEYRYETFNTEIAKWKSG